eukprot:381505-Hanusia_phi.AAC.3
MSLTCHGSPSRLLTSLEIHCKRTSSDRFSPVISSAPAPPAVDVLTRSGEATRSAGMEKICDRSDGEDGRARRRIRGCIQSHHIVTDADQQENKEL